ncbi:alpha-L-fucosidase [Microterricola pindariensis]|uniref:alpha-L-fucosidase n=1 Tax=Microterricola pindariensis TaxID=478010 RepID=A0ABX5AWQ5_9MICO|nr:alpha-L-fucosidase [Microterricola pindariensis]PPL18959.1 alpha-L-fucosidase [Microterricola pindariensis]
MRPSPQEYNAVSAPDWFTAARFGMFVHFGLYSGAARHEWVQTNEKLTDADYRQYFDNFDPDLFDAAEIARTAKQAGMSYVVLTTKHHEGFALWNTALSDFNSAAACGRDLVRELVDALRAAGLKVGLYHSLIDWHHPDFTVDWVHPRRDDENAASLNEGRDMARYREFLLGQVRELLTDYGQVDYLFFDYTYPEAKQGWAGKSAADWDAEGLLALCRELQPGMIVNDRLGIPGDFVTPEQYQPTEPLVADGVPVLWEACQTTNGSWGYDRDNDNHKSADLLIRMLADSVSMGGNMLLNVGPNGRGALDKRDTALLAEIGEWMRLHERAVVGAGHAAHRPPREGVYTQRGNKLYLHVFTWPMGFLHLPELAGKVSYARLLHDGSWVKTSVSDPDQQALVTQPAGQAAGTLTLSLPTRRPDVAMPVIELTLAD